ncbi:MAG: porin [bacterium]
MKWLYCWCLLTGLLLFSAPVSGQTVSPSSGALEMGGYAKFVYAFSVKDEDTMWEGRDEFYTSLVGLRLHGVLSEHLSYNLEIAAGYNPERDQGGLAGFPNPGEVGTIGVREAYFTVSNAIPWTTVKAGTFIPPVTNYMPRPVTSLDLIQYPLLNNASRMTPDLFAKDNRPPARDLSTWQQTGFNLSIEPPYLVKLDLGMYNGMMPDGQANGDRNVAEAVNAVMTFEPDDRLSVSMAYWGEEFQMEYPGYASGAKRNLTIWYLYGSYTTSNLEVYADYAQAQIPRMQLDNTGEFTDLSWESWQITAGYRILNNVSLWARYEEIDPNLADRVQVPQSRYDDSKWTTIGVNWRLFENVELSGNYVHKEEEARDIDEGEPGQDPTLPLYDPKYSAQKNDLFLLQLQVWQ